MTKLLLGGFSRNSPGDGGTLLAAIDAFHRLRNAMLGTSADNLFLPGTWYWYVIIWSKRQGFRRYQLVAFSSASNRPRECDTTSTFFKLHEISCTQDLQQLL